jgi:hypothetical protein
MAIPTDGPGTHGRDTRDPGTPALRAAPRSLAGPRDPQASGRAGGLRVWGLRAGGLRAGGLRAGGLRAGGLRVSGGGTAGNELLTTLVGALLIAPLAVIALTLVRMHQLIWVHLFVGLALIGPVAVKLASTGYRFVRYYTHDPEYRRKGPPPIALRLLGPALVATTVAVLASGIVLMLDGPARRGSWLLIHKVSFIVWGVLIAIHVLAHLPALAQLRRGSAARAAAARPAARPGGGPGRALAIGAGLVGGLLLATLLIPDFAAWTSGLAFKHH